ncbi:MAG TPA: Cu(I)-responsive transcriptional regulator [Burkholderiales bacterium]|nr:Cu(I)-responsive transcriptional regulator [Burkholderiales bacterium]
MNIGEAAKRAGVNAKRVRHYEAIGLVAKAVRSEGNYRSYSETDVHTLRFIKQARALGFAIEDIRALLNLWRDRRRPSREVKKLVQRHAAELRGRIAELQSMVDALEHLAHHCHGDERPECPILDDLASPARNLPASERSNILK